MEPQTLLAADSQSAFFASLRTIDRTVPPRTEARKTEHTEVHDVCVLLGTLASEEAFGFPVKVIHRDRPDFLVCAGDMTIGIEHTEAVSQNAAHEMALSESGIGPAVRYIRHHHPGEKKKQAKVLIREIEENRMTPGWEGDSVECEWNDAMQFFVATKVKKAQKPGFERFPANWLLVHDNWVLPALNIAKALDKLCGDLHANPPFDIFDRIFIITHSQLIEIAAAASSIRGAWNE